MVGLLGLLGLLERIGACMYEKPLFQILGGGWAGLGMVQRKSGNTLMILNFACCVGFRWVLANVPPRYLLAADNGKTLVAECSGSMW